MTINNVAGSTGFNSSERMTRVFTLDLSRRGLASRVDVAASDRAEVFKLLDSTFRDVNFAGLERSLNTEQFEALNRLEELGLIDAPHRERLEAQHYSKTREENLFGLPQADVEMGGVSGAGAVGVSETGSQSHDGSSDSREYPTLRTHTPAGGASRGTAAALNPNPNPDGAPAQPANPRAGRPVGFTGAMSMLAGKVLEWAPASLATVGLGAIAVPVMKSVKGVMEESKKPVHDDVALAARVLLPVGVGAVAAGVIWQRVQYESMKRKLNAQLNDQGAALSQMEQGLRTTQERVEVLASQFGNRSL
ncbi:MAG: hypothetical protein RIR70_1661 [Pseudomonadota bacterium]